MPTLTAPEWQLRGRTLKLDRPIILSILNTTPDSFSDGGEYFDLDDAVAGAEAMLDEGADILDVGGESTRPQGAVQVEAAEEARRVVPLIERIHKMRPRALISIDTWKSSVAEAALEAGASIVNDVSGFRLDPRMGEIAAAAGAGVILMHS